MDPHQRDTFDQIEEELTSLLAGEFQDIPRHRYYQFVPIRDTEIGGVLKDCGLRRDPVLIMEANLINKVEFSENDTYGENSMQRGRRFSY